MWIKEFVSFAFLLSSFSFSAQKSMSPAFTSNFTAPRALTACWSSLQSFLRLLSDFFVSPAVVQHLHLHLFSQMISPALWYWCSLHNRHSVTFAFFLSFCCGFSWETWSCHTPPREGFVLVQSGVFNNMLHCILTAVLKSYQVSLIPPSIWQLLSAGFPSSSFSVCTVVILQKPTSFQREQVISMLIWKDPIILSSSSPLCLKHTHTDKHTRRVSSNTILMRWWPFSCFNCLQLVLIPSEHINHT